MRKWLLSLLMCAGLMAAQPVQAFGLRTHLWIAQRIVDDLRPDCTVGIRGGRYAVPPEVCQSIRNNPGAFLAGVVGPDGYPDLITGQVTTHPGIPGDWQTADWLNTLYGKAAPGRELAFAAGYVAHAAGDTFAHSYVNTYAGDIFVLTDEVAVERRHFVLEKYIDYRLPGGEPDPDRMDAPAGFLSRELIFSGDANRTARKSGSAPHISAMYAVRTGVVAADDALRDIEGDAANFVADLAAQYVDLQGKIASGETSLEGAKAALLVNEERLKLQQQALDTAKSGLDSAIDAVDRNNALIATSELQAKAAREAINAAEDTINSASRVRQDLQGQLIDLQREIRTVPTRIARNVCNEVAGACERNCPRWLPCNWVCGPTRTICHVVEETNSAWTRLNNQISDVEQRINRAQGEIERATASKTANLAKEANALQAKAQAEAARAALDASRAAAQASYDAVKLAYDVELAATKAARAEVDRLQTELANLRQRLLDTDGIRIALADLIKGLKPLSFYTSNWKKGIDVAGERYIEASLASTKALVKGGGGTLAPYREWLSCYGPAFTPTPYQIPEAVCKGEAAYAKFEAELDKIVDRVLPEPFRSVYREFNTLKARVKSDLKVATEQAALDLAKVAAPDATTGDFIELLVRPENATREKLREVFATNADAGGKDLLVFQDAAALIDEDLGLTNGKVDPARFKALEYAVILAKLSLLDQRGVQAVAHAGGADRRALRLGDYPRYSVLIDSLRSIDGNHQWQPFGLPYPRGTGPGSPQDPEKRRFGYGPTDKPTGFPLFVDPNLRRTAFQYLFPQAFGGEVLKRPELGPGRYAFPTCAANPFPVTFSPSGGPAAEDPTCTAVARPDVPHRPSPGLRLLRWWRSLFQ